MASASTQGAGCAHCGRPEMVRRTKLETAVAQSTVYVPSSEQSSRHHAG
eukprot:CAMPEP_0206057118 /NCGR_PEP_ID=MMETSP1466-20131121/43659_1 /ASSEMBLY_ACC=CAM_ASM_001126 /TAXON_ID=44452 /ORGANISM="Pavlova gyrans, Strain CCMP608" /LENGTH=48 /DNA_ID= /DNA_START= /DNA_END= /DNA_ORIENTATION=